MKSWLVHDGILIMAYCNPYMGISKNKGTPKWMVYNGKPYQKWMIWAENLPIFGNIHIIWAVQSLLKPTVLVTASITVADYFLMSQKKKHGAIPTDYLLLNPNSTTIQHTLWWLWCSLSPNLRIQGPHHPCVYPNARSPSIAWGKVTSKNGPKKNIKFDHSLPKKNAWGKELHDLEGVLTPFYRGKIGAQVFCIFVGVWGGEKGVKPENFLQRIRWNWDDVHWKKAAFFVLFHGVFFVKAVEIVPQKSFFCGTRQKKTSTQAVGIRLNVPPTNQDIDQRKHPPLPATLSRCSGVFSFKVPLCPRIFVECRRLLWEKKLWGFPAL